MCNCGKKLEVFLISFYLNQYRSFLCVKIGGIISFYLNLNQYRFLCVTAGKSRKIEGIISFYLNRNQYRSLCVTVGKKLNVSLVSFYLNQ